MPIETKSRQHILGIVIGILVVAIAVRVVVSPTGSPGIPAAITPSEPASVGAPTYRVTPSEVGADFGTPASQSLADSWAVLQAAVTSGNVQQLEDLAQVAGAVAPDDAAERAESERLRRQALRARDELMGTIYLDTGTMQLWALTDDKGQPLVAPADMSVGGGQLYVLDSGVLYRTPVPAVAVEMQELSMTLFLSPDDLIDGFPIKELVGVEAGADGTVVYALDKSNDLYRYDSATDAWRLQPMAADRHDDPSPLYLNMGTFDNRLYMLDPARNQVWRSPPNDSGDGVMPSVLPWLVPPGGFDVSNGVDLAVDGSVYALMRSGRVVVYPATAAGFDAVEAADAATSVTGLRAAGSRPSAIVLGSSGSDLFVADPGRRRIVRLDRSSGEFIGQWIAPDAPWFDHLNALAVDGGRLLMVAGQSVAAVAIDQAVRPDTTRLTELPEFVAQTGAGDSDVPTGDLAPNDPGLPARLAARHFNMPIEGALLPDRNAVYPGSRRTYRYGVHEGLDLYAKDIGVPVVDGTHVVAIGDGVIQRIDSDYREMTLGEVNGLLDEAHALHITPIDTLAKLNGRQVWIDHADGIASRYSHLSAVDADLQVGQQVRAGQVIGNVGLSGTPDGIVGNTQFPHLHFELRFGGEFPYDHYLGKWLTTEQTRRAFERIFAVPVRPAYLDER